MVGVVTSNSTTTTKTKKLSTVTLLKALIVALLVCVCVLTYLLAFHHDDAFSVDPSSHQRHIHHHHHQLLEPKVAAGGNDEAIEKNHQQQKNKKQPTDQEAEEDPKNHVSSTTSINSGVVKDADDSSCTKEYERFMSQKTQGLTEEDLLRSRAWVGNEERLSRLVTKLKQSTTINGGGGNTDNVAAVPVNVVICGGSITLGHGVEPQVTSRYSNKLEDWLNDKFPLPNPKQQQQQQQHKVYNHGSHGADMCAMAKRMDMVFDKLQFIPDLIVLEFAVNDYQGQDHKIHLDHKTDLFFDGFQQKAICAEAIIYNLIQKYPNTAIMFLEFQTAILNRKTAQLLHMGVAQHYQIPVISYAEAMMPGYYHLIDQFKDYEYSAPIGDTIAPYPHGCAPCQEQHITQQFRHGGCSCVFCLGKTGALSWKELSHSTRQKHFLSA